MWKRDFNCFSNPILDYFMRSVRAVCDLRFSKQLRREIHIKIYSVLET